MVKVVIMTALSVILGFAPYVESHEGPATEVPPKLELFSDWMTGAFSSCAQALEDSAYHDVRLHMVRIWPHRVDGYWLYVEQALASAMDQPYRQRVYHVDHIGGAYYCSTVYTVPDPSRFRGAWRNESALAELTPEDLIRKAGCTLVLKEQGDSFIGSTLGRLCRSSLHGASYATSEVEIRKDRLVSWDRGFNVTGKQVWGATEGAYVFDKVSDYPLE
jgi:hypothetical protein